MRAAARLLAALYLLVLAPSCQASGVPYTRYFAKTNDKGENVADTTRMEYDTETDSSAEGNSFSNWFHHIVRNDRAGLQHNLKDLFLGGAVPLNASFQNLLESLNLTQGEAHSAQKRDLAAMAPLRPPHVPHDWDVLEANELFGHLGFPLDASCVSDKANWWYRTYDGSCNWIKAGESGQGSYGEPKSRDYGQYFYADGISEPRHGPNPRAVSNAFFKRKKEIYFEHTPLLLGLIEFVIHDVTWSQDSETECIEVPMPEDETEFAPNATFKVWRAEAAPGTGTSPQNPRENLNRATTWIDVSSLYGSTRSVAMALRSFDGGKLKTQQVPKAKAKKSSRRRGHSAAGSTTDATASEHASASKDTEAYLPFDTMGVPVRSPPGFEPAGLFAGGDPRTNEDWVMIAVHSLLLREHNRLCDILAGQRPEFDDEQLYQTTRLIMSAKFQLIANSYQMAYYEKSMPWPQDDGYPLFRQIKGENWAQMNPANNYPWPLAMKEGRPVVVSAEMAVVYRFHEFIINEFPIVDAGGNTLWNQSLFDTGFDAQGFIDAGLENVLRGITSSTIPNFKSGIDESFRSAGKYRGSPFDIATWSIVHEREQGLPTFNNYFRAYNMQKPSVVVPIRSTFEEFSTDPEAVANLKRLYKTPDDVDLVVGCQLDETMFPHTTVPTSSLIISLFNLISMGSADRFSVGYAAMRCWLVDKPWDCHPSNALEDLLWKPVPRDGFPNFRFYDDFWMQELDFQSHGQNLLWRLVTENTDIDCLQQYPLWPADADTNPVLCKPPKQKVDWRVIAATTIEITLALSKQYYVSLLAIVSMVAAAVYRLKNARAHKDGYPEVLAGWPLLGEGAAFQKDAKAVLVKGFKTLGNLNTPSRAFGIHLGPQTHYVLSHPEDLQMMRDDNPYQVYFNIDQFFKLLGAPIFLGKDTFATNLHATLLRKHLGDPAKIRAFGTTMDAAAKHFLANNALVPAGMTSITHETLSGYMDEFSTAVSARCMLGADAYDHPELVALFLKFNDAINMTMQMSSILPAWLGFIPKIQIDKSYKAFRKVFVPIIQKRRIDPDAGQDGLLDFMPWVLDVVDDDNRASDLIAISVWFGLRNLQVSVTSALLDIINEPGVADTITASLAGATLDSLDTFQYQTSAKTDVLNEKSAVGGLDTKGVAPCGGGTAGSPWALLRSATLESIRLCGTITGPARMITSPNPPPFLGSIFPFLDTRHIRLRSDPSVKLPADTVATLSTYYTHRSPSSFGPGAAQYRADRFVLESPGVGTVRNISFGLQGPRICPGQWFVQEAICIMVKEILEAYTFSPIITRLTDDDKYAYSAGVVTRKEVPVVVSRRSSPI
ncbi:animal heme peroxidase superfamily [Ophiostoma piceae UAMH 11346]|uniref:Animal heme peroxidase superfamily n=1 Tax=Ophiostoma piceae (strain UAMH 11346) TaxID=1262450 RepID=S3C1D5_OPHP1|nr:animal heme peroxidase superfamily [Ophiostoma piceae UAMH 11346]